MDAHNSMRGLDFILANIYWGLIIWIYYKGILFRSYGQLSMEKSRYVLWGLVIIICVIGMLLEMRHRRNWLSVFVNLSMGFGIYTVLTYIQVRKKFVMICVIVVTVLSVIYAMLILCRRIRNRKKAGRILRRRMHRAVSATYIIEGLGMALIMVVLGINDLSGSAVLGNQALAAAEESVSQQTIANNIEKLSLIWPETWDGLSSAERLDVLQTVADIEQRYLGIPDEITVVTKPLNDDDEEGTVVCMGDYVLGRSEIYIDTDHLMNASSSWDALNTVCHEMYHVYQFYLTEALDQMDKGSRNLQIFRKANIYADEFENYIEGEEDFDSYYAQNCESDARDYAEEAVCDYYEKIYEYLYEDE